MRMKRKTKPLIAILIFGAVFVAAIFIYSIIVSSGEEPINLARRGFEPGEALMPAPEFTIQDQFGEYIHFSELRGTPIVLNFWNTWCHHCVDEKHLFSDLHWDRLNELHVIKVNLMDGEQETLDTVLRFMIQNDYTFPIYFDTTGVTANAYAVEAVPVTLFINADGYIRYRIHGPVNELTLQRGLDFIM